MRNRHFFEGGMFFEMLVGAAAGLLLLGLVVGLQYLGACLGWCQPPTFEKPAPPMRQVVKAHRRSHHRAAPQSPETPPEAL